jgi:hypothetical protein
MRSSIKKFGKGRIISQSFGLDLYSTSISFKADGTQPQKDSWASTQVGAQVRGHVLYTLSYIHPRVD